MTWTVAGSLSYPVRIVVAVSGGCRAFQFMLDPTVKQRQALDRLLVEQCRLYNAALEERRGAWRLERRSVTRFEQYKTLTGPDTVGWKLNENSRRLYLQGVGHVKVHLHRPARGQPKTITVLRVGRRWQVTSTPP